MLLSSIEAAYRVEFVYFYWEMLFCVAPLGLVIAVCGERALANSSVSGPHTWTPSLGLPPYLPV
jgi:hypothetical protein